MGSLQGRAFNSTPPKSESFICHFHGFVRTFRQLFSSKLLFTTAPNMAKLGTKSLGQMIMHAIEFGPILYAKRSSFLN